MHKEIDHINNVYIWQIINTLRHVKDIECLRLEYPQIYTYLSECINVLNEMSNALVKVSEIAKETSRNKDNEQSYKKQAYHFIISTNQVEKFKEFCNENKNINYETDLLNIIGNDIIKGGK